MLSCVFARVTCRFVSQLLCVLMPQAADRPVAPNTTRSYWRPCCLSVMMNDGSIQAEESNQNLRLVNNITGMEKQGTSTSKMYLGDVNYVASASAPAIGGVVAINIVIMLQSMRIFAHFEFEIMVLSIRLKILVEYRIVGITDCKYIRTFDSIGSVSSRVGNHTAGTSWGGAGILLT